MNAAPSENVTAEALHPGSAFQRSAIVFHQIAWLQGKPGQHQPPDVIALEAMRESLRSDSFSFLPSH
jgi:hypothetical protein